MSCHNKITVEEPFFLSNEEWYDYDITTLKYVLTDKATKEARESYNEFYELIETLPIKEE